VTGGLGRARLRQDLLGDRDRGAPLIVGQQSQQRLHVRLAPIPHAASRTAAGGRQDERR
jgi:hypothetical protein